MSEIRANSITDAAGTGAPNFPNGFEVGGAPFAPGTQTFTATGALSNGDLVGIKIDGTVSVVTPVFGTDTVFESANISQPSVAYDPVNGKVVVAYMDAENSYYRTAVVGTVSGASISFGTPVVFLAASYGNFSPTACVFDSASGKFVIAYTNSSAHGVAIVGTVSGTTISFGSAVTFEAASTAFISAAYHSASGKIVISYRDEGNSNYGTAIVGTVSGTSISFGAATVFESATTNYTSCVYDTANNRIVIFYQDAGNSNFGTAAVGTVSGTSISFGTPVVYASAATALASRGAAYDAVSGKSVLVYTDQSTFTTKVIAGTVSGTAISFGAPTTITGYNGSFSQVCSASGGVITVILNESVSSMRVSGTGVFLNKTLTRSATNPFIGDSTSIASAGSGAVYVYRSSPSGFGVGQFIDMSSTFNNWVGVAAESIADGAEGKVTVVGGIVSGLSGLTTGLTYGVSSVTGALTAGTTNAIGLAISATELYINTGRIE